MMGVARAHATADSNTRAIKQRIKQARMHWIHSIHELSAFLPCIGCTHSMDWMDSFYGLDAFIPLIDCMHSMCWVHSILLVWLCPFHVLGASILCVGFIHPMHWMHSSICCMHSFHCGLNAFVPLVGCISLHWLSAFLLWIASIHSFVECIHSMGWSHREHFTCFSIV